MSSEDAPEAGDSRFLRAAAVVGDLGSPFYEEERDRDVWNEASAIGFQALLWGLPLAVTAALWIGGASALVPSGLVLLVWIGAGALVLGYVRRFDVDPNARTPFLAGRRALWVAVMGLLGTGVVRAALDLEVAGTSMAASFLRGMGQGAAATSGLLVVVLVGLLARDAIRTRRGPVPPRG